MEKYAVLLGYFDKQLKLINRLFDEIVDVDLSVYEKRYLFALKAQQWYSALEDLFKQIAKAFENNIDNLSSYHKELLVRLSTDIPNIRPALLSNESFTFLDKVRAFRHFIRHAYDCELDEEELRILQGRLKNKSQKLYQDFDLFKGYIESLV